MKIALTRLLASMKFWTTLAGVLTVLCARYGFQVDRETILTIGGLFGILLGSQGLADQGKHAEQIRAETQRAALDGVLAPGTETNPSDVPVTAAPAAGVASALVVMLVLGAGLSNAGCGAAQDCRKPENMNSLKCTAINEVIDCTRGELPKVVDQFGPVVSKLIDEATGADASIDWQHVEGMLGTLGSAYGACIVGNIIQSYAMAPPKLSPGEVKPSLTALKAGYEHARIALWKLDPGVRVRTAKGTL